MPGMGDPVFRTAPRRKRGFDVSSSPAAWPVVPLRFPAGNFPDARGGRRCIGSASLVRGAWEEAGAVRPAARGVCWEVRLLSIAAQVRRWHRRQIGGGLGTAARGDSEDLAQAPWTLADPGRAAGNEEAGKGRTRRLHRVPW